MRMCWTLLALVALALPARARADDPFADFRIPSHGWRSGSATASLNRHGLHSVSWDEFEERDSATEGALTGSLLQAWDSDALRWVLNAGANGDLQDDSRDDRDRGPVSLTDRRAASQIARQGWFVQGALRAYPWSVPVGLDVSARMTGSYSQLWERDDDHGESFVPAAMVSDERDVTRSHSGAYDLAASGTLGIGRVRDATVVMDVHVLEQRLLEAGALTRPLSPGAREALAALEATAPSLAVVFERPDRRLWKAIESVLREDGALSERGLDAYALLRARERYQFARARPIGWFIGPQFTLEHAGYHTAYARETWINAIDFLSPPDTVAMHTLSTLRVTRYFDSAWLGGSALFHRPIGWDWQVDLAGTMSGPIRPGDVGLRTNVVAEIVWFVADRWQAAATLSQSRSYYTPRADRGARILPYWSVDYGGSLGYYVEDHTLLQLTLHESQAGGQSPAGSHDYQRENQVDLSVTYRFLGRVAAPGLFDGAQPAR